MNDVSSRDALGAFVPGSDVRIPGAPSGPLKGVTLAVKDLYDISGQRTGAGNPDYLAEQKPAIRHAWAVQTLLGAGAVVVGRTITVEMALGMSGDNIHYGMPKNPAAPDRVPGGSSCGSASAVAGGAAELALGSDTGGSVRIPGSYCGIYGLRPTHGRIPLDGVVPLSPSFDTAGHFARDAELFERAGRVLLRETAAPPAPWRLLWAEDAFAHGEPATVAAITPLAEKIASRIGRMDKGRMCPGSLEEWAQDFRTLMAREAWQIHGSWIETKKPRFGADVAQRFTIASRITDADVAAAKPRRAAITRHLTELLADGTVLVQPTSPGPAPLKSSPAAVIEEARYHAHALCCAAGLAGLPQITIPAGTVDGAPVGLSLLAAPGGDAMLLRLARDIAS
ncbi:MAG TPA: amidase [Alphaproteobacteria bacterium]|nr:amidase [Alphaproteobacteria bacterium]